MEAFVPVDGVIPRAGVSDYYMVRSVSDFS